MDGWEHVGFDLLRMNSDWLWRVDASGQLVEWRSTNSPEKNEAGPEGFGFWKGVLRDDACLRDDRAILFRTLREGKPFRYLRTACIMPHLGVRGWLRVSGVPIRDARSNLQGYQGAALNITGAMMTTRKLKRADKHTQLDDGAGSQPAGSLSGPTKTGGLADYLCQRRAGEFQRLRSPEFSRSVGSVHDGRKRTGSWWR